MSKKIGRALSWNTAFLPFEYAAKRVKLLLSPSPVCLTLEEPTIGPRARPKRWSQATVVVRTISLRLSTAGREGGCIWMRVQLKRMEGDAAFAGGHRSFNGCHLILSSPFSHTPSRKSTIVYPMYLKCVPSEQLATSTPSPNHSTQNHRYRQRVGACHQLLLLATTYVAGIGRMLFVRAGGGAVRQWARGDDDRGPPTQSSASRKEHNIPSIAGLRSFSRIGPLRTRSDFLTRQRVQVMGWMRKG
ncbi:hypothetical protein CPC08DRAFT_226467 [Agrocybe pediades]|nr:hypothetical protein CPC08DRAFT_226467 [Agrocybe pediades]